MDVGSGRLRGARSARACGACRGARRLPTGRMEPRVGAAMLAAGWAEMKSWKGVVGDP